MSFNSLYYKYRDTNENIIALPGNLTLQLLIDKKDGTWEYKTDLSIKHDKPLCAVMWNKNSNNLLTSCIENKFKLWNYETKQILEYFNGTEGIYNIRYSNENHCFVILDRSGFISVWDDVEKSVVEVKKGKSKLVMEEEDEEMNELELMNKLDIALNGQQTKQEEEESKDDMEIQQENNKTGRGLDSISKEVKDLNLFDKNDEKKYSPNKKQKSYADQIIDFNLQHIVHSSSTNLKQTRKFLCWNLVGSISLRDDTEISFIDIEFVNRAFHKNLSIRNIYNLSIGAMNEKGAIMAGRADTVNNGKEYDNEEDRDEIIKDSHIFFKPFKSYINSEEWSYKLEDGEVIFSFRYFIYLLECRSSSYW